VQHFENVRQLHLPLRGAHVVKVREGDTDDFPMESNVNGKQSADDAMRLVGPSDLAVKLPRASWERNLRAAA
jgi:hypothetical protein